MGASALPSGDKRLTTGDFDLIVNATTVGMGGSGGGAADLKSLPIRADSLGETHQLVDLAYGPAETELARAARAQGATVIDGLEVLVRQGAASLRIWTGQDPPVETMRRAARARCESSNRPGHLRPVPDPGEATARKLDDGLSEAASNGVTPPMHRGHSGMFVTDVIVELGYATGERVDEVIHEARVAGRSPEALLREHNVIDGDQLSRAIAERYGLDHVDLSLYKVDMGAANLVSVAAARRYKSIPVGYVDKETLLLAMADPANVLAVDDIQMMTGLNCRVAVAAEDDIEALIGRLNTLESAVSEAVSEDEELEGEAEVTELRESADDAPVIKLVYSVLGQAVAEGASDIHFEPDEGEMRVRFRVDGVLQRGRAGAEADGLRGGLEGEDDERHGHRREASAPGRPRERQCRGAEGRPARDHAADPARGGLHDPHPRQEPGDADAGRARDGGRRAGAVRGGLHQALRRGPGDRADRLREVDHALRGAPGAERGGAQHHHDRGPGRVPDLGHQPARRATARQGSPSPPACARSCAPTPT